MAKVKGATHYETKVCQRLADGGPVKKTVKMPSGAQQWTRGKDAGDRLRTIIDHTDYKGDLTNKKTVPGQMAAAFKDENEASDASYDAWKRAHDAYMKLPKSQRRPAAFKGKPRG